MARQKSMKKFLFVFWIVSLAGCATRDYNDAIVVGMPKEKVLYELFWVKERPDAVQVYFDEDSGTEVFFPDWGRWTSFEDQDEFLGDILIFKGVTRPTECPLSVNDTPPSYAELDHNAFCYRGDGHLYKRLPVKGVAEAVIKDDNKLSSFLLAAVEEYYSRRERLVSSKIPYYEFRSSSNPLRDARRFYIDERQESHWQLVKKNFELESWFVVNGPDSWVDNKENFEGNVKSDPDFLAAIEKQWRWMKRREQQSQRTARASISGPTASSSGPTSTSTSTFTSAFFDGLGEVLGIAIGAWIAQEAGLEVDAGSAISDSDLRKIQEAARKGQRRALRAANRKARIQQNLKVPPPIK
jgi:hypothetical protein